MNKIRGKTFIFNTFFFFSFSTIFFMADRNCWSKSVTNRKNTVNMFYLMKKREAGCKLWTVLGSRVDGRGARSTFNSVVTHLQKAEVVTLPAVERLSATVAPTILKEGSQEKLEALQLWRHQLVTDFSPPLRTFGKASF